MRNTPSGPIHALSFLLEKWVTALPLAEVQDTARLNFMWLRLAESLSGALDSQHMQPFQAEFAELGRSSRAGFPPCQALEQRLRELVNAGLREPFLVVAVRQGLDRLIAENFPSGLLEWTTLADEIMPVDIQFGYQEGDPNQHGRRYTYTVG
ncbi:MAG: hypothetical protein M3Z66_00805 [Chloroflexota bacterium]|nr:hypothetical protein [Chloroflexota bacterium]